MPALYNLFGLNQPIFLAVNGLHGVIVDRIALLGSQLGESSNLLWILGIAAFMWVVQASPDNARRSWRLPERNTISQFVFVLLAGYALAGVSVSLLKAGLQMPRPSLAVPSITVHLLGETETSYGFPSGHAAFAMMLTIALWAHCRARAKACLVLFAAWVGISRVIVGAHFPVDVIAGYLCGGLSSWAAIQAMNFYSTRKARKTAG